MLQALIRTITEILDSRKAAYSFIAVAVAVVLHLQFGVPPENAILLVSPLGVATVAQAHVDAKRGATGASGSTSSTTASTSETTTTTTPTTQDVPPV